MTEHTELITGPSLFVRLGKYKRTGKVFFSPDITIREFYRHSKTHDGKLIVTLNAGGGPDFILNPERMNLILWSVYSNKALVGTIIDSDTPYDPANPPHINGFSVPSPWDRLDMKVWVAVEDVHLVTIDVRQYQTWPREASGRKIEALEDTLKRPGAYLQRIQPKPTAISFEEPPTTR